MERFSRCHSSLDTMFSVMMYFSSPTREILPPSHFIGDSHFLCTNILPVNHVNVEDTLAHLSSSSLAVYVYSAFCLFFFVSPLFPLFTCVNWKRILIYSPLNQSLALCESFEMMNHIHTQHSSVLLPLLLLLLLLLLSFTCFSSRILLFNFLLLFSLRPSPRNQITSENDSLSLSPSLILTECTFTLHGWQS